MDNNEQNQAQQNYGIDEELKLQLDSAIENRQKSSLVRLINDPHIADIAEYLGSLNSADKEFFLEIVKSYLEPEFIIKLHDSIRNEVVNILGTKFVAKLIAKLDIDDSIHLVEELDEELAQEVLNNLSVKLRQELEEGLSYPEDSAGRIMRKKIISIPKHWNIAKITSFCYENKAILSDDFYKIYVVDHRHKPIGSLLISRLLTHHSKEIAADIMNKEVMAINTDMNEEEVALLFHKYGIVSAPVINEHGRMVGEITIDDIVNIIREVAEDDILHLGGVNESDIFSSFLNTTKKRFPWLFVNMLTAIIASMVIATFDTAIQNLVVLAVLMPIIASMGGNAGTQTVTVAVRSLAMREINESNYFSIIRKETLVGLLNGLLFGGLMGVAIFFIYDSSFLGILFSAATLMTLVFAGFFGALIPIILTKLKADPAVSSVVFLTTITDVAAFFGFLGLATLFIK